MEVWHSGGSHHSDTDQYGKVWKGMAGYGGVYGKAVVAIRALSGLSLGSDNVLMPTSQL